MALKRWRLEDLERLRKHVWGFGLLGHGFANLGQRDLLDSQRVVLGVRDCGLVGGTSLRGGRRVLSEGSRHLLLPQRDSWVPWQNLWFREGTFFSHAGSS